MRRLVHVIAALLLVPGAAAVSGLGAADRQTRQAAAANPTTSRFTVLVRGIRIGSEEVEVTRQPSGGMRILASGILEPPVDLITHKFEMIYTSDWQPQSLTIEGLLGGEALALTTRFGVTTATSDMVQGRKRGSVTHDVTPRAVVLPRNFFGAYEVFAARLGADTPPGTRIPVYVAPDGELSATVERVTDRRVSSPHGSMALKEYDLTFSQPRANNVQIWVDERGRMARLVVPSASVMVVRDDLSSVMVREEKVRHPGDEDVFIPASGFSLAATITQPKTAERRKPMVILVGAPGRQDRDEVLYGMPVFGELAGALAEAGYLVVRFDKRGIGQSGGRPEHATINEYAEDVLAIVRWARRRDDVDRDRIAVLGHGEGGAVAMLAAAREDDVKALALVNAPGATGREVTLAQQERALAAGGAPAAEVQAKVALQRQIMDAAVSGDGWDAIPPDIRRQTDTPWYRSWLTFDPADTIRRTDAPILILHGALDAEMPVAYADRLEALSAARDRDRPERTAKVVLDGVNHLLVDAKTGAVTEYETLEKSLSPAVVAALTEWLATAIPGR